MWKKQGMQTYKCAEYQNPLAGGICRHFLLTRFQRRGERSQPLVIALYLLCRNRAIKFLLKSTGSLQGAKYFLSGQWTRAIAWEIVIVPQAFVLIYPKSLKLLQISEANSFLRAGLALGTVSPNRNTRLSQWESEVIFVVVK